MNVSSPGELDALIDSETGANIDNGLGFIILEEMHSAGHPEHPRDRKTVRTGIRVRSVPFCDLKAFRTARHTTTNLITWSDRRRYVNIHLLLWAPSYSPALVVPRRRRFATDKETNRPVELEGTEGSATYTLTGYPIAPELDKADLTREAIAQRMLTSVLPVLLPNTDTDKLLTEMAKHLKAAGATPALAPSAASQQTQKATP